MANFRNIHEGNQSLIIGATSASYALSSSYARSSSYAANVPSTGVIGTVANATSASYAITSSYSVNATTAATASHMNAGNITLGTLNDGRLSSNVPLLNSGNIFSTTQYVTSVGGNSAWAANVTGDSAFRWVTFVDGKMEWGPGNATRDTNLYRSAANILKTDDAFQIAGSLTVGGRTIINTDKILDDALSANVPLKNGDNTLTNINLFTTPSAANSNIRVAVDGDVGYRFKVLGDGDLLWGDGTSLSITDTNLYRSAAGVLKTDSSFIAAGGLGVGTAEIVSSARVMNYVTVANRTSTHNIATAQRTGNIAVAAAGWYRIAVNGNPESGAGGTRAHAHFAVRDETSGNHSYTYFIVNIQYGNRPTVTVLSRSYYGATGVITKIRIVESGVNSGAAVEVYVDKAASVNAVMYENEGGLGFTLQNFVAGNLPAGFSSYEVDLTELVMGAWQTGAEVFSATPTTFSAPAFSEGGTLLSTKYAGASHTHLFSTLSGSLGIGQIGATGTPSATTYLRGDGTWSALPSDIAYIDTDNNWTTQQGITVAATSNAMWYGKLTGDSVARMALYADRLELGTGAGARDTIIRRVGVGALATDGNFRVDGPLIQNAYSSVAQVGYNVVNWRVNGTSTGAIVIKTTIPSTHSRMTTLRVFGYKYSTAGDAVLNTIIGGYWYSSPLTRHSMVHLGSWKPMMRLMTTPDGYFCVVIDDIADSRSYPNITVEIVQQGHSIVGDTYFTGWTISNVTDLSTYTAKGTWSDNSNIAWSGVTGTPTTIAGYGITDAPTKTGTGASGTWGISITGNAASASSVAWATGVSGKPTTLSGYGITDAVPSTYLGTAAAATDHNALDDAGVRFSYAGSSATNRPPGTDHAVMTLNYSTAWSAQLASDWRTNEWYVRNQNNSTWGPWAILLHTGNYSTTLDTRYAQKATTISGYGITDAYTKTETDGKYTIQGSSNALAPSYTVAALDGGTNASYGRAVNRAPSTYWKSLSFEFKERAAVGIGGAGNYAGLLTLAGYSDASAGTTHGQLGFAGDVLQWRSATWGAGPWSAWQTILHSGNYTDWTVPKTGGTFSGNLTVTGTFTNGGTLTTSAAQHTMNTPYGYIQIGPMNTGTAHIYTDRPSFYFNKSILVLGDTVLHTGNYSSYTVPSSGGTFTGTVTGNAGFVSGDNKFYFGSSANYIQGGTGDFSIIKNTGSAVRFLTGGLLASDAYADASNIPANGIWSKGNVYGSGFYTHSSRTLKENIVNFTESALSLINGVSIVNFVYKTDEKKAPRVGFIAEDTHPLLAGVEQNSMDQANSVGLLIKAVQELTAKLVQAEKRLEAAGL